MMGVEMMLANMIGVKPDDLRVMIEGFSNAATEGVEALKRIEQKQDAILAQLKGPENGDERGSQGND